MSTYENFQYLAQVGAPANTTFKNTYTAPTTTTTQPQLQLQLQLQPLRLLLHRQRQ